MKVIVAGSRGFSSMWLLTKKLDKILKHVSKSEKVEIVSGCARGADTLAIEYARKRGYSVKRMPADWNKYGPSAGYKRNEQMAEYGDALVAFWDGQSSGTNHMINLACRYSLKVRVIRYQ